MRVRSCCILLIAGKPRRSCWSVRRALATSARACPIAANLTCRRQQAGITGRCEVRDARSGCTRRGTHRGVLTRQDGRPYSCTIALPAAASLPRESPSRVSRTGWATGFGNRTTAVLIIVDYYMMRVGTARHGTALHCADSYDSGSASASWSSSVVASVPR